MKRSPGRRATFIWQSPTASSSSGRFLSGVATVRQKRERQKREAEKRETEQILPD
jgi:hypothetical protein